MKSLLGTILDRSPVPLGGGTINPLSALASSSPTSKALDAMSQVGTLFAIVNRTSNSTAQADWHLYRKAATGKKEDRTPVARHAALDLWNMPNATTPRQQFVEGQRQHIDLTGESWWVIGRNPSSTIPLEMWHVRPDRMSVSVGESGVTGYVYRGPAGVKIPLDLDQVVPLMMPNPSDQWRGLGPVQSILTELDTVQYTTEWNRNFFRNSAEPGGIIEMGVTLSDPEFQQMRTRWHEQHRGVSNAHRVAILEGGAKWIGNGYTMADMQFAELRSVSRDTIREAFGFPKPLLGAVDDVNRANAEAAEVVFGRWLSVPRLDRIRSALNHRLLPLFPGSDGLEFDYINPVPKSPLDERQALNSASLALQRFVSAGFDPGEAVAALGLPPMRHLGFDDDEAT